MLDRKLLTLLALPAILAVSACATQDTADSGAPAAADRPSPYEARAAAEAEAEEREQNRRDEDESSPPD